MENKQELLEDAAKVMGLNNHRFCEAWGGMAAYTLQDGYYGPTWNPLQSDADAHRLGAALHANVTHMSFLTDAWEIHVGWEGWPPVVERVIGDPAKALRHAYTRFAAEVWKESKTAIGAGVV